MEIVEQIESNFDEVNDPEVLLVGGAMRKTTVKRKTVKRSTRGGSKSAGKQKRVKRSTRGGSKSIAKRKKPVKRRATGGAVVRRRTVVRRKPVGSGRVRSAGAKTRKPSAYNMFVKKFFANWKKSDMNDYLSYPQTERMRFAAQEWRNS